MKGMKWKKGMAVFLSLLLTVCMFSGLVCSSAGAKGKRNV